MGVGDWKFHIFSPGNFKTVESCALVSVFNSAGDQMKLTFFFVQFFIINDYEVSNVYGKNTDFHN